MADPNGIRDKYKRINRIMESRDGQNINHRIMQSGIHEGTSAMGEYGIMPTTAQDMLKHSKDPLDQLIVDSDPNRVEEILKGNPQVYDRLVDKETNKIANKTEDPVAASLLWNAGSNHSSDEINKLITQNPGNFVGRTKNAIDEAHLSSGDSTNIYDYIQSLKDYDDFKKKRQDRLFNPTDLDENDVNLKIPEK